MVEGCAAGLGAGLRSRWCRRAGARGARCCRRARLMGSSSTGSWQLGCSRWPAPGTGACSTADLPSWGAPAAGAAAIGFCRGGRVQALAAAALLVARAGGRPYRLGAARRARRRAAAWEPGGGCCARPRSSSPAAEVVSPSSASSAEPSTPSRTWSSRRESSEQLSAELRLRCCLHLEPTGGDIAMSDAENTPTVPPIASDLLRIRTDFGAFLTEDEAADLLSVGLATLGAWRRNGGGPPFMELGDAARGPLSGGAAPTVPRGSGRRLLAPVRGAAGAGGGEALASESGAVWSDLPVAQRPPAAHRPRQVRAVAAIAQLEQGLEVPGRLDLSDLERLRDDRRCRDRGCRPAAPRSLGL